MREDIRDRASAIIADNRLNRTKLDELDEATRPADLKDAYQVQAAHNKILSAQGMGALAGYKIGCTTPVLQDYMNIHEPIYGEIFASTFHHGHADLNLADFVELGIEAEIAVRLGGDLPIAGTLYNADTVRHAIGAVMISIELVDARYRDFRSLDTPTMAADNFFNAGAVLGEAVEDWYDLDLAALEATVALNGTELGRGQGSLILGHPLNALAWLANRLAERKRYLPAGAFVTLGSVVVTHWAEKGDRINHRIPGLGEVSVSVT
jgi:2-keto-4-pentenoate hydratase